MRKSKLPCFSIKGDTLQQLIEIEPILVMLGYNIPDEEWNNKVCDTGIDDLLLFSILSKNAYLLAYDKKVGYHNHDGIYEWKHFHVTDIKEIIKYVESFKK